jgi:CSLREA domain-containing protein
MRARFPLGALAVGVAAGLLVSRGATAANPPLVVNSVADLHDANPGNGVCETAAGNGVCTLRAAVEESNALPGADTITFDPGFPAGTTFLLSLGHLEIIQSELTIVGNGPEDTIIDGDGTATGDRALLIDFTAFEPFAVAISDLTIRGGAPSDSVPIGGGIRSTELCTLRLTRVTVTQNSATKGGGISSGPLILDHCVVSDNDASEIGGGVLATTLDVRSSTIQGNSATEAGGIYAPAGTIAESLIAGNTATGGGGGLEVYNDSVSIVNTTVSGNTAGGNGGGIWSRFGDARLFNATVVGNECGNGLSGGGLGVESTATATIANSILSGNFFSAPPFTVSHDCGGTVGSLDYNLVETTNGCTITGAASHNVYGSNPKLGVLQGNGGPTLTRALLAGSPGIDAGNVAGCTGPLGATLGTDQRGFVRPINGRCDMGAFESGSPGPPSASPQALSVDAAPSGTADGNRVLEPGETAVAAPSWKNAGGSALSLSGTASLFSGPAGATYTIADGSAAYGTLASGATGSCSASADCYALTASPNGLRPVSHWDATFVETPSTGDPAKTWTVHVGGSFADVPKTQPFYAKIETLLHAGITVGCTAGTYCPGQTVSRAEMAIFIARGLARGAPIPAIGSLDGHTYNCVDGGVSRFDDVAPTDVFCRHVHYIAARNVALGCAPSLYCPGDAVTRVQMASFIAKATVAPAGGTAVPEIYGPDPDTGLSYSCDAGSPAAHFTDVPATDVFCKHAHYLWARGIVSGCSPTQYCPGSNVTRDQMAKFLVNAFALSLYGP